MRFRSFVIAYALVPGLFLFALRRPAPRPQNRYSQVIDLTASALVKTGSQARSETRIIAPAALASGTWGAAQIPPERLIGPLVIMDMNASSAQISITDIANWEARHGHVPLGAIVGVGNPSITKQMSRQCRTGFFHETDKNAGARLVPLSQVPMRL